MKTGKQLKDVQREFFDYQRARHLAENTIRHYQQTFDDLDRYIQATHRPRVVGVLTTSNLQAFSTWLAETPLRVVWRGSTKRSITGLHGRMKDLRAFVRWCIEREYLPGSTTVPLPKLPEAHFTILRDEQLVTVFSSKYLTATGAQGVRNRALIGVLLDTGVRLSELASIDLAHLYLGDKVIRVTGKGNKTRHVYFSDGTGASLDEWLDIRGGEPGTLFLLTKHGIRMLLKRIEVDTGIHLHAHLFRHQAGTMMIRDGMDPLTLKRILGHAQLSTVEIYVNLADEDKRAKHNAASPMDKVRSMLPDGQAKKPRRRLKL